MAFKQAELRQTERKMRRTLTIAVIGALLAVVGVIALKAGSHPRKVLVSSGVVGDSTTAVPSSSTSSVPESTVVATTTTSAGSTSTTGGGTWDTPMTSQQAISIVKADPQVDPSSTEVAKLMNWGEFFAVSGGGQANPTAYVPSDPVWVVEVIGGYTPGFGQTQKDTWAVLVVDPPSGDIKVAEGAGGPDAPYWGAFPDHSQS